MENVYEYLNNLDDDFDILPEDENEYDNPDKIDISLSNELYNVLMELIEDDDMSEEFISKKSLMRHYNKHCVGGSNYTKSVYTNVFYDFINIDDYRNYENNLLNLKLNSINQIGNLYDYDLIFKYLRKLFEGNTTIIFTNSCGLKNNKGIVNMTLHSFATKYTEKNYKNGNTIDILIQSSIDKSITLYPVDAHYLESKLNKIIDKYSFYTGDPYKFNND